MNMRWQIQGNDPYVKENVGMTLGSVFAPFLSKGSWEKKEKAVWTPVNFSQVINLFHIPTKNNFVKKDLAGLQEIFILSSANAAISSIL